MGLNPSVYGFYFQRTQGKYLVHIALLGVWVKPKDNHFILSFGCNNPNKLVKKRVYKGFQIFSRIFISEGTISPKIVLL